MNVPLPFAESHAALPGIILLLLAIVVAMLWAFRRRGWI
jgi:MYXO-CTERM domain-containing protein